MDPDEPDFLSSARGAEAERKRALEFERKFLEYAYAPYAPVELRATEVAHATRFPISEAEKLLEELAARDVLVRQVDDEGFVFYRLPGRKRGEPSPSSLMVQEPAPLQTRTPETQATMGLVLNLVLPGVGSIVAGRTAEGIAQLILFTVGLPLCFLLIGIPLCVAVWGWALASGLRAVQDAHRQNETR